MYPPYLPSLYALFDKLFPILKWWIFLFVFVIPVCLFQLVSLDFKLLSFTFVINFSILLITKYVYRLNLYLKELVLYGHS